MLRRRIMWALFRTRRQRVSVRITRIFPTVATRPVASQEREREREKSSIQVSISDICKEEEQTVSL
jgi:hypothetical protein